MKAQDMVQLTEPAVGLNFGRRTPTVSVVIPAMNEAENLPYVLPKIPDGSTRCSS